jgi:hypothetical protein
MTALRAGRAIEMAALRAGRAIEMVPPTQAPHASGTAWEQDDE